MVLDFAGWVALVAVIIVNAHVFLQALGIGRGARLGLAVLAGLWVGLQLALSSAGAFTGAFAAAYPVIGLMVVLPPAAAALAAALSHRVRAALIGLPAATLVALHAARIFGVCFVLLAAAGRMAGPFPYSAGWGDVITGLAAIPLAFRIARHSAPVALAGWNLFGAADLAAAVILGTLSFNGSVVQLIDAGVGSNAVAETPWVLIPTVLVPFYLITHGIIFAQLTAGRRGVPKPAALPSRS